MNDKKLIFKPVGPQEDFNRPSEVIAYASRQVREEMEKTFKLFREETGKESKKMLTRIQFDLTNDRIEMMNSIMFECGLGTRKELFNTALNLLSWAARQKKEGRIISSVDEKSGSYRELIL